MQLPRRTPAPVPAKKNTRRNRVLVGVGAAVVSMAARYVAQRRSAGSRTSKI